jgi:hypothetical protein
MCALAYSFRQEPAILGIVLVQSVLSLLTLVFIALLASGAETRRIFALIGRDLRVSGRVFLCGFGDSKLLDKIWREGLR